MADSLRRFGLIRSWALLLVLQGVAYAAMKIRAAQSARRHAAEATPRPLSLYRPPVVDLTAVRDEDPKDTE